MDCLTVSCYIFQEGCKIDWPAWVQAVGSVGAIIAAIWISSNQAKIAREQSQADTRERYKKSLTILHGVMNDFFEYACTINEIRNDPKVKEPMSGRQAYRHYFSHLMDTYNLIDTREFPTTKTFVNAQNFKGWMNIALREVLRFEGITTDHFELGVGDLNGPVWIEICTELKISLDAIKEELDAY